MNKMRFAKLCYFNLTFYIVKQKDLHSAKVIACVLLFMLLVKAFNLKYILSIFNSSIKIIHSLNGQILFKDKW